jgi:hypothetical protein
MGKPITKLRQEYNAAYEAYLHAFNQFHDQYSKWSETGDKNALKKARQLQGAVNPAFDKVEAALKAYGTAMNALAKKKAAVFKKSPALLEQHNKLVDRCTEQVAVVNAVRGWFKSCVDAMPKK